MLIFLTSTLVRGERSASRPGHFTLGERIHGTHWIGRWVDPRAGLDDVEKRKFLTLPGLELRPPPLVVQAVARRYSDCAIVYAALSRSDSLAEGSIFCLILSQTLLMFTLLPSFPKLQNVLRLASKSFPIHCHSIIRHCAV
jgi:hypothetical protein